jgi:hypothetical protein
MMTLWLCYKSEWCVTPNGITGSPLLPVPDQNGVRLKWRAVSGRTVAMCTETLSLMTAHIHIAYTDPSSCAFGTRMQAPFMRVSEAIFCANDRTKNDKRQGCEFGAYSENGLQTTIRIVGTSKL